MSEPQTTLLKIMKSAYTLLFITFSVTIGQAQTETEFPIKEKVNSFHPEGSWLLGAGATYLGLTAKGGVFAADQLWVGAEAEKHNFLSERREVGLASRYYVGKGRMHGFLGTGVSYGYFKFDSWVIDNYEQPKTYHSIKLNTLAGAEIHLTRHISIEGVAKMGWLTEASGYLPSVQGSINVLLGK